MKKNKHQESKALVEIPLLICVFVLTGILLLTPASAVDLINFAEDPSTDVTECGAPLTGGTATEQYGLNNLRGNAALYFEAVTPPAIPSCWGSNHIKSEFEFPAQDRYGIDGFSSTYDASISFTMKSDRRSLTLNQVTDIRATGLVGHLFLCGYTEVSGSLAAGGECHYVKTPGDCFKSCTECQNRFENACFTCKSAFTLDWTDESNKKKKGRCLCEKGAVNAAGTGCDLTICHETCGSCKEAGADKCYTCLHSSFTEGARADDGTLASCTNDYTGGCDASCATCFGPNANQCLTCSTPGSTPDPTAKTCPSVAVSSSCHETCETCSADNAQDKCLTCKNLGAAGTLSLLNGECRCQPGTYFVSGEARCAACHTDCSSCNGPGADKCLTCSDGTKLIENGVSGRCVSAYDSNGVLRSQYVGRVATPTLESTTASGLTVISADNFQVALAPERIPNKDNRNTVRVSFPTSVATRIRELGTSFNAREAVILSAENGQQEGRDYSISTTVSNNGEVVDLKFTFNQSPRDQFLRGRVSFTQNYFFNNLPNKGASSRRILQSFATTNKEIIESTPLLINGSYKFALTVQDFNESGAETNSVFGIILRILIYLAVLAGTVGMVFLVFTDSTAKATTIAKYLEFVCSLTWIVKIAFVPALSSLYELVFVDEIVKVDTLVMAEVAKERGDQEQFDG